MPRNEKATHENFINYADFIIHHPVYKRLPIKQKKDGSYQFVTAKGSEIGQGRLKWIEEKARELAEATANRLPDEILGSNADVHVSSAESALALAERMKSEHNFDF